MTDVLRLALRPSRGLALALGAGHAFALAAAWIALPVSAAGLVAAGVLLSAWAQIRRALLVDPRAVVALRLGADGSVEIVCRSGEWSRGTLRAGSAPLPWLAVLVVQDERGRRSSLAVVPDCVGRDELRRLRVWIRWRPFVAERAKSEHFAR